VTVTRGRRLVLTLGSVSLALLAQYLTAQNWRSVSAWLPYVGAVCLMVVAARGVKLSARRSIANVPRRRLGGRGVVLGLLAVGVVGAATALAPGRWHATALGLWIAGLLASTWAVRGWIVSPPQGAGAPWSRPEMLMLAALLTLSALARCLWIETLPYYYFADEARVAMYLQNTYGRGIPNFFTMGWNTWPVVGLSWQGVFAPILGLNITALRLSSALMGTLAVLATYLLARELSTPRFAGLSALLLALCRTAIDFSRLGTCHAQVMFLEPIAFFFWWRAIRTGRASSYLWAGISLGLCLYTYNAGQSAPLVWVGWVILCALGLPRVSPAPWRGVVIVVAGLSLTFLPYFIFVTDRFAFGPNWDEWTIMLRNRQVAGQLAEAWNSRGLGATFDIVRQQIVYTWLGFHLIPAGAYALGYRGGGMLDHVTGALFVLGLGVAVVRVRQAPFTFLIACWLLTTVTGGVLTSSPPAFVRLVGILPAVTMLAAVPLEMFLRMTADGPRSRWFGFICVAVLLAAAGWQNWRTYFIEFPRDEVDLASLLARHLERLPRDRDVFLLGSEYAWRPQGFQANQLYFHQELFLVNFREQLLRDVAEPSHFLPLRQKPDAPVLLVLGPSQLLLEEYIRTLYPDAHTIEGGPQRREFRIVEIPVADIERRAGLTLVENDEGVEPVPRVADPFEPRAARAGQRQRRLWTGSVYWPTDRPVTLSVRTSEGAAVHIADTPVVQPDGPHAVEARLQHPRGWLSIRIEEPGDAEHALRIDLKDDRGETISISRWDVRPEGAREGVAAVYERDGNLILRTTDPQLNSTADERVFHELNPLPVKMPFRVSWQSYLRIEQSGVYDFELHATGPASVILDGQAVAEVAHGSGVEAVVARGRRQLDAGDHRFTAHWDCTQCSNSWRRVLQFYWKPPGGNRQLVPPTAFVTDEAPH